ncbi:MAG: hypothetical protein KDJ37_03575 [Hyphomicrobiaceae bacterium]|nr:hypothetical protein [Hyphomicrobiaceae bacterium]
MTLIVLIGLVCIVGGILGAFLAGLKNRDYSFWAAWGFVFPPSILLLLLLPKVVGPRPRRPTLDEEDRMHF